MTDLIDRLRSSRKNPSVLKLKLISVRSVRPDTLVFVFEGPEDVGVYEAWISRTTSKPVYEPIPGSGKEQLIGLRDLLSIEDPQLLHRVHFFVDCDFDEFPHPDDHVFTLDSYSMENLVCSKETLESLLTDEFRCAGSPEQRQRIVEQFERICRDFKNSALEINFALFTARQQSIKVSKKPEQITDIADIRLTEVVPAFTDVSEVISLEVEPDATEIDRLKQKFAELSDERAQRGKYVFQMFRRWLRSLADDARSHAPVLFDQTTVVSGDPSGVSLRRLASSSVLPAGLDAFVTRTTENIK
ncbi:DUF4435 domain-containing protein [Burkholderia arboris]|uniref:DUF4435 domain-containing protein n=1 Tax=Burkholderia arboris TaxID=488730 RepID=UPI00210BBF63|nr:DUF4435 domain-containing protein [Burkholderia arboris]UTV56086.1 DUF4435 domain-containing protein [Burkholderia arboris]